MAKKIDILIIGNGFDIFHGLPTRYTDFLEFIKHWDKFYNWYNNNLSKNHKSNFNALSIRLNNGSISLESVYDFATYATIYNKESIKFFNDHYDSNFWINYLTDNLNDNGGWIDFEKEIENTLSIIENLFSHLLPECDGDFTDIVSSGNGQFIYGIIDDLSKCVGEDFVELIFSINSDDKMNKTKRKLIDALKNQLDELNQMLQIYLKEFVSRIPIQIKSNDISVLGDYYLLSFNYTNTCNTLYMMNNSASHYIHGNIETDIVLGISDDAFDNNDFIYFQKYFQRIQKRTGNEYLKWLKDPISYPSDDITLHIFGHSLDKTDKGILEYFFKNIDLNSIIIYYHNQEAYENQVINLVDMFGKDYVIENTGTGRIVFKELEKPVSISQNSATIHLETV